MKEFAAQFEGHAGSVVLMTSGIHKEPMTRELDDARWVTGQTIDSEGGFRRSG